LAGVRSRRGSARNGSNDSPIQHDELRIEHDQGDVEIVVYNRAVLLFTTESEAVRRIHQVCCQLEDIGATPPGVSSAVHSPGRSQALPRQGFGCSGHLPVRRQPTATRRGSNGGEARWSALAPLPDFGTRVLPASAVVAYVAVGAAAILGRSVTEAARDALAWVLARNGKAQRSKE